MAGARAARRPPSIVRMPAVAFLATLAAVVVLSMPLPIELRWLGAYAVLVVLPGWLLVRVALPSHAGIGALERAVLALGAGYPLAMLVGLATVTPLRPVAGWQITALASALVLALVAVAARRPSSPQASAATVRDWRAARPWLPPLLVLLVAGPLRLADLGWSEFQGDEARILLRAMAALQGVPDALAAHRKVPGEILLSLPFYGQLGAIGELTGRLPFALAGVAGVLAFSLLARELLGPRAGVIAALLLAVNGYFVAFGRILQYDSLAFFLGTLGLLCSLRFARLHQATGCPPTGLAFLGALCLFGAVLVALGAVFFVPPALVLLAPSLRRARELSPRVVAAALWPALPGLLAVALVVWPPGAADGTGGVWSYLGPRLGGSRPYWNLDAFLRSANHYLSTPYLALTLGGGLLFVLDATRRYLAGASARAALFRVAAALGVAALAWARPLTAGALGAGVLVGALLLSPRIALGGRVAIAWAAGPLLVHLFLIRFSGTHWREAFPGLAMLAAVVLVWPMRSRWSTALVGTSLAAVLVGSAHYSWVTLVQRWPEYQMTYPRDRHPLDLAGGDGRGIGGVFGVAHRHGWKAAGVLTEQGTLVGSYATNESSAIAAWYVRRPQGCPEPPALVFRVPRAPQDRNLPSPIPLPEEYVTGGRVLVDGHTGITILVPPGSPKLGDARLAGLDERFDQEGDTSPWRPIGSLYLPDLGAAAARRACNAT